VVAPTVELVGASVVGAVHRRQGRPNQDALAWWPSDGRGTSVAAALSDGHGHRAGFRSDVGSALAAGLATDLLGERLGRTGLLPEEPLAEAVLAGWRTAVRRHLAGHPLTPAETELLGGSAQETPYGATLLTVAVAPDGVHLAQLGDGDILAVAADGSVSRPVPRDRRLFANETTSLCGGRAQDMAEVWLRGPRPRLLLLATDGYSNSFADDDALLKAATDLDEVVARDGIEAVGRSLPQWLAETTEQGAGDDVTVAVVSIPDGSPS
jgi:serine/threonine protein phosphatase PrpC